jgi:hypothetical protein
LVKDLSARAKMPSERGYSYIGITGLVILSLLTLIVSHLLLSVLASWPCNRFYAENVYLCRMCGGLHGL